MFCGLVFLNVSSSSAKGETRLANSLSKCLLFFSFHLVRQPCFYIRRNNMDMHLYRSPVRLLWHFHIWGDLTRFSGHS